MKHKRKKNSGKLMALIIAIIMVSSIAGFVILDSNTPDQLEYNGYKFKRDNKGIFSTEINKIELQFNYHPADVAKIPFKESDIALLKNSDIIMITSDIESPLQRAISLLEFELERNLIAFNLQATHGFTEENKNELPVITCDLADKKSPVIYIKKDNSTNIKLNESCFTITANNEYEVMRIKDALLYRLSGII